MRHYRVEYEIFRLIRLRRVDGFRLRHHPAVGLHNAGSVESPGLAASKSE